MPSPRANESRDQYLERCMGDSEMVGEFGDNDQRYAVCVSYWQNKKAMNTIQHKVYDLKALDVDTSNRSVKVAIAEMESIDRDGDVFDKSAFDKTIAERGPLGSNEIWHLINHERKLESSLGKFQKLYKEGKYIVGENNYRDMFLWKEVAWPLYERGDITQHSVGFTVLNQQKAVDHNVITQVALWEGSAVLWGANPNTPTFDVVKSFLEQKKETAFDYMAWVIKKLKDGKYAGENESLLVNELQEVSALFLPQETAQKDMKPQEAALDVNNLRKAIDIQLLKFIK
ncbi:MAG: HK97 family phage prohead protease [bacterium]